MSNLNERSQWIISMNNFMDELQVDHSPIQLYNSIIQFEY